MTENTFDIEPEFWPLYEQCKPYTMTSVERMYALWAAVRHVHHKGIPGDIVECGVWRGGSMLLVALSLAALGDTSRRLWLYDTYEGMTEPSGEDVQHMSGETATRILEGAERSDDDPFWAIAPLEGVEQTMRASGYPAESMEFVVGKVEETIPRQKPDSIALLRLDTDWYNSTRVELERLYPRLASKGVLIIDDYGYWRGAKQAVDEYFDGRADAPFLSRIDYTGRIGIKL